MILYTSLPLIRESNTHQHPVPDLAHRWSTQMAHSSLAPKSSIRSERISEKTLLPLQVQSARSNDTDQSRVQRNTGINAVASKVLRRPTKVRSVIRDERPISFENGRFQFPILQSRKTQVIDV